MEQNGINKRVLGDHAALLELGPTLDNTNVQLFVQALIDLENQGYTHVIIDMERLEFISSAGVGAIFSRVAPLRKSGGDIVLCNVSGNILYVLTELDLAEYLTIKPTMREATAACGLET